MQPAAPHEPPDAVGDSGALSWRVPAGLVVGVIALGVGIAVLDALSLYLVTHRPGEAELLASGGDALAEHRRHLDRLALAGPALGIAAAVVALSGALALRRQAEPSRWRHAVWLGMLAVLLGYAVPAFAPPGWIAPHRMSGLESGLPATGITLFSIGVLGLGWASRRVRVAATPLLVAGLVMFPPSLLTPPLVPLLPYGWGVAAARWSWWTIAHLGAALLFAALAIGVSMAALARRPLVATTSWARSASGFRWAGWALVAHVVVAIAAGLLAQVATVERSRSLFNLWSVALPLGFVLVAANLAIALLRAADLVGERAPRVPLCVAAGVVAWSVALQALQLVAAAAVRHVDPRQASKILGLMWSAKIVAGAVAAGCLIAAIASVAARMHLRVTPRAAIITAWLFGVGAVVAGIGAEVAINRVRNTDQPVGAGTIVAVALAGVAALTALLSLAILTLRLARDLGIAARLSPRRR